MVRENLLIGKLSGICLNAIAAFAEKMAHSACIWWLYQPKEPDILAQKEDGCI